MRHSMPGRPITNDRVAPSPSPRETPRGRTDGRPHHPVSRRRRTEQYLEAIGRLDPRTGRIVDAGAVAEAIRAEFGAADALPVGIVSRCYLGPAFDVHTLDLTGGILEHFSPHQPLPAGYEPARRLAQHDAYLAIEIYHDRCVCLRADGRAVEVPHP